MALADERVAKALEIGTPIGLNGGVGFPDRQASSLIRLIRSISATAPVAGARLCRAKPHLLVL
jgi:hypothetical protein